MNLSDYKKECSNLIKLVELITSEIKCNEDKKEKWASFKNKNEHIIRKLLNITNEEIQNPCNLVSFDIEKERKLLLLNYTAQAHNVLHVYENGWSNEIKLCRGLVFSFENKVKIISRSFEKFFNANEMTINTFESLQKNFDSKKLFNVYEKLDGHMIEYFSINNELYSTTRGKFNTASAQESLNLMTKEEFDLCKTDLKKQHNIDLMSVVVELVTPSTEVLVKYNGEESIYILAMYDTNGDKINYQYLDFVSSYFNFSKLPERRQYTIPQILKEIKRRDIDNHEGWVLDLNGTLLKFKYNNYIGLMVSSKLSYKYLMQRKMTSTTNKMISTLNQEKLEEALTLLSNIEKKVVECRKISSYKPLYELWSDEEGGLSYFRTVCRKFYKTFIMCN